MKKKKSQKESTGVSAQTAVPQPSDSSVPDVNRLNTETLVMNNRLAVVLGVDSAWQTWDQESGILLATHRSVVGAVLTGDTAKAISCWSKLAKRPRDFDPDNETIRFEVVWVPIGSTFRITWDDEIERECIEIFNSTEWYFATDYQ
jgi:hypothetical protein